MTDYIGSLLLIILYFINIKHCLYFIYILPKLLSSVTLSEVDKSGMEKVMINPWIDVYCMVGCTDFCQFQVSSSKFYTVRMSLNFFRSAQMLKFSYPWNKNSPMSSSPVFSGLVSF